MPMQFYHVVVKPISKQFCTVVSGCRIFAGFQVFPDPAKGLQTVQQVQSLKEEKDEKESCGIDDECCYGFLTGSLR